jgi:hypothetical protein
MRLDNDFDELSLGGLFMATLLSEGHPKGHPCRPTASPSELDLPRIASYNEV